MPVPGRERIAGIDLARGLAVLGMLAAHLLVLPPQGLWHDPRTWLILVDGRPSILFATLAGVSLGLVSGGPHPFAPERMRGVRGRLALRAGVLFVLGILLILTRVPVYVILPAYAILFLLAVPFLRLRGPVLLALAAVVGAVSPFVQAWLDDSELWQSPAGPEVALLLGWNYPFPVWLAFVLAGMGLARFDLRAGRVQAALVAGGALLALVSAIVAPGVDDASAWSAAPHSSGVGEVFGSGGFAVAVLGASLLLCRARAATALSLPLRATGAMPLTAYILQLLLWVALAWVRVGDPGELEAFLELRPFLPLSLATVSACTAWWLVVGRGPVETLLARIAPLGTAPLGREDRLER